MSLDRLEMTGIASLPPVFDSVKFYERESHTQVACHNQGTLCCHRDTASMRAVFGGLVRCIVASRLPEAAWYSAAEAAVTAIYALHPAPQVFPLPVMARAPCRPDLHPERCKLD